MGLTKNVALEYATQGIRANAVGPTYINTDLVNYVPAEQRAELANVQPMGRLGEAAGVDSFEFTHMVVKPRLVRGRRKIKVAFDGEVARMRAPIHIRVLDKPLYLLQAAGAEGAPAAKG